MLFLAGDWLGVTNGPVCTMYSGTVVGRGLRGEKDGSCVPGSCLDVGSGR